jgi:hypothetical protein
MKNIKYIILLLASVSFVFTGCNDYLDVPKSKSSAFEPESVEDLEMLLNNYSSYSQERNNVAILGTDDYDLDVNFALAAPSAYGPSNAQYATWDVENLANDDRNYWSTEWKKVFDFNMIIETVDGLAGDEITKTRLKQEAHFLRAYSYYNLVNTYCLPYSEANKEEMGLPVETSISFSGTGERASLKETYDLILSDLEIALELDVDLEVVNNKNRSWRASTASVKAFAARFYLSMHDYVNAQKFAEEALAEHSDLIDYNTDMRYSDRPRTAFVDGVPTEIKAPYTIDEQQDPSDRMEWKELYLYRLLDNPWWYNIPSDDLLNTYDQTYDLRFVYHNVEHWSYFYFRYNYNKSAWMHFFFGETISGPTVAEMLLIKAECQVRTDDWSNAMTTLNQLRVLRMDNTAPANVINLSAASKAEALTNVLEERRRELAFNSRWFDLRRYNSNNDPSDDVTITRNFFEISGSAILGGPGAPIVTYTLEPNSRRYAMPIPQTEIVNTNGVLKQNTY